MLTMVKFLSKQEYQQLLCTPSTQDKSVGADSNSNQDYRSDLIVEAVVVKRIKFDSRGGGELVEE